MKSLINLSSSGLNSCIIRTNFDVPIKSGDVADDTRILDAIDSLNLIKETCPNVVIISHLGRPGGKFNPNYSLEPVYEYLKNNWDQNIQFIPYTTFPDMAKTAKAKPGIIMLDNLRFTKAEEEPNAGFTELLASLGEAYVNECFATSHRRHASIVELPKKLPSFMGLHLEKEVKILHKIRSHPAKPAVLVLGGAKLETKLPIIEHFLPLVDKVLVGGKLALEASGHISSNDKIQIANLTENKRDIDKDSAQAFSRQIAQAQTVIWNGTMGVFEETENRSGTEIVAEAVASLSGFTLVGGGDTEAALTDLNLTSKIGHISSGGGAMLEYLAKGDLPGLEALRGRVDLLSD